MAVDITATIVIERPITEVSSYAGDPSNAPDWSRRIERADWDTAPPIALGSRITFGARFLGRALEYTCEITEYTPGEQVAVRTTGAPFPMGPFPMATTSTWREVGPHKTHMVLRNHGEPTGFSKLTVPIMRRAMRRAMNHDLDRLKRLLETR